MSLLAFLGTPGGGALAQGAANLFGGMFKGSDPESATRNQKWQFRRQRDMFGWQTDWAKEATGHAMQDVFRTAAASGIHRLAALGGASAYQPSGMSVGGPGPTEQQPFMGDAMSEALNTYIRGKEFEHRKKMDQAELDLLKAQSKTLEAEARRTETGTQAISRATMESVYNQQEPEAGRQTVTSDKLDKDGILQVHPGHLDAEMAQTRRGQIAEEIQGANNAYHDNRWRRAVARIRAAVGTEQTKKLIEQHINNPEYLIKKSKTMKPKKRTSHGISPHFSK